MANFLSDAFYWATTGTTASEIERQQAEADAKNAEITADLYARGKITKPQYQESMERIAGDDLRPTEEVWQAAKEGAAEGLAAEQAFVKGAVNSVAGGVLGFVPWWVWPLGAGLLAWKLGLLDGLLRRR